MVQGATRFSPDACRPDAQVLDLCCGTGDMTLALLRHRPNNGRPVLAADFAHQMLLRGAAKFGPRGALAIEADALHLPFSAGRSICSPLPSAFVIWPTTGRAWKSFIAR